MCPFSKFQILFFHVQIDEPFTTFADLTTAKFDYRQNLTFCLTDKSFLDLSESFRTVQEIDIFLPIGLMYCRKFSMSW